MIHAQKETDVGVSPEQLKDDAARGAPSTEYVRHHVVLAAEEELG